MLSVPVQGILVLAISWVLWQLVRPLVLKTPLSNLPGPRPKSFWQGELVSSRSCYVNYITIFRVGNLPQIFNRHGWAFQDDIDKEGRAVVRITTMFKVGEDDFDVAIY